MWCKRPLCTYNEQLRVGCFPNSSLPASPISYFRPHAFHGHIVRLRIPLRSLRFYVAPELCSLGATAPTHKAHHLDKAVSHVQTLSALEAGSWSWVVLLAVLLPRGDVFCIHTARLWQSAYHCTRRSIDASIVHQLCVFDQMGIYGTGRLTSQPVFSDVELVCACCDV